MPFIVVSDGMDQNQFEALQSVEQFEVHPQKKISQDDLKKLLPKIEGLVIRSATKPNKEIIDSAPNLKYIIRAGEGTDNIDKAYCQERGIKVSNTPGANNNSAAEHAIALMMSTLRKVPWAHQSMKEGRWDKSLYTGVELWKKKIGIIGLGRIGQILARRLQGFEVEVLYYDPSLKSCDIANCTKVNDIKELFKLCDIISIHIPLMEKTKNMIDFELLSLMQPTSILINAARGQIVNEDDLYTILKERKIRAAAFDVFASEPLPEATKLRELDNFIMTPHLGASTEEAQVRVGEMSVNQMKEFFLNNNLLNEVKA